MPKDKAANLSNPFALLGAVQLDANVKLSKVLAQKWAALSTRKKLAAANVQSETPMTDEELNTQAKSQADMQLNMMTIQKVLLDDGESYSTKLIFKGGELLVNDQPMPLPFF